MPEHDPPVDPGFSDIPPDVPAIEVVEAMLDEFALHTMMLMAIHHHLTEHPDGLTCPRCNDKLPTCANFRMIPKNIAHQIACVPIKTGERLCDDCLRANADLN